MGACCSGTFDMLSACRPFGFLLLSFALVGTVFAAVEWKDSPLLTRMWQEIAGGRYNGLLDILLNAPDAASHRASDGRGPVFWAYEFKNEDALALLLAFQAPEDGADAGGKLPTQTFKGSAAELAEFQNRARNRVESLQKIASARAKELSEAQKAQEQKYQRQQEEESSSEEEAQAQTSEDEESIGAQELEKKKQQEARLKKLNSLKANRQNFEL
eukprot:c772_g1_i1.p1 GENE.c772_g1_i1~~c772_g1_i1.p1  ORF type:complete len:215 (-),score=64.10 c772_g1_i1:42-686(-)